MTPLRYSLAIDTAKVYRVRAVDRHAWANAAIRTWPKGGSIDVQSDYGSYSHIWVDIGQGPFLKFLCELEYDYFMRKTRGEYRPFDSKATRKAIVRWILEARSQSSIDAQRARYLFNEARRYETHELMSPDALAAQFSDSMSRFLNGDFPMHTRDNDETRGFWLVIWPMLTDAWRRELELQQVAA